MLTNIVRTYIRGTDLVPLPRIPSFQVANIGQQVHRHDPRSYVYGEEGGGERQSAFDFENDSVVD